MNLEGDDPKQRTHSQIHELTIRIFELFAKPPFKYFDFESFSPLYSLDNREELRQLKKFP